LLPVHALVDERRLVERRMRNYWGYNTLGYFAPEGRYSSVAGAAEFKTMVKRAARRRDRGAARRRLQPHVRGKSPRPTLSFRGIDNAAYYRLTEGSRRHYVDTTGCGNTLNLEHPRVLQMVIDSLRYWVEVMHVDGFRFDLTRRSRARRRRFNRNGGFSQGRAAGSGAQSRQADRRAVGPRRRRLPGRQLPAGWAEWNDRYRDTMRGYWKGDGGCSARSPGASRARPISTRGRGRTASINFITAHDGFTLHDLVSYNEAQRANGEETATATTTTCRGTAARKARPTIRSERAARAPEAQLPRDAAAVAGRADAAGGDERSHTQLATTTRTARTTRRAGSTGPRRRNALRSPSSCAS
jgi:glycogen operon protein